MDRREFLTNVWKYGVRPILLIIILYFSLKFLVNFIVNLFNENSGERVIIFLVLGITVLLITAHFIGIIFNKIIVSIHNILPEPIKNFIKVFKKIVTLLFPILLGILIYYFWNEDLRYVIFIFIVVIEQIIVIIRKKKWKNIFA